VCPGGDGTSWWWCRSEVVRLGGSPCSNPHTTPTIRLTIFKKRQNPQ
jgi:hypothetical protein